jgi:hypothetical protein
MGDHRCLRVADKNSTREETAPRRKISRAEWPAIGTRYAAGESLASIARHYRCTAPAIRYIVKTERQLDGRGNAEARKENRVRSRQAVWANKTVDIPSTPARDDEAPLMGSPTATGRALGPRGGAKTGGFDVSLREGMTMEISRFLVAFDAVVALDTAEAFNQLREAADRLLRATAQIRIELERGPRHPAGRGNT